MLFDTVLKHTACEMQLHLNNSRDQSKWTRSLPPPGEHSEVFVSTRGQTNLLLLAPLETTLTLKTAAP